MSNLSFGFKAFIKESIDVLINPKSYFSTMKTTGGVTEPLIKALIYGALAGIIDFLWGVVDFGNSMFGRFHGLMLIIWIVIGAIVLLFVGGLILMIISAICRGSKDYEASVRVNASLMVILPLSALLGFVEHLNVTAGVIVSLAISIFALYLLYHGLIETLKANPDSARVAIIILAVLTALILIFGAGTVKKYDKMKSNLEKTFEDLNKK
ncbi:MAG: Yip1 family protein [Bacteroidia bacterium]|jgi:hypothetical protein|nr:Yip1 family protein [Bacteroidia bacterium]